jgi:hypothetical protein
MTMLLHGGIKHNDVINVTLGKIQAYKNSPSPFGILQMHFSIQKVETSTNINNLSHFG